MDNEIRECYQNLELQPGAPLDAVQAAYEDLSDLWNPDQYADSPRHRRLAQKRFMKIRVSYEILVDYFLNELPGNGPSTEPAQRPAPSRPAPASTPEAGPRNGNAPVAPRADTAVQPRRPARTVGSAPGPRPAGANTPATGKTVPIHSHRNTEDEAISTGRAVPVAPKRTASEPARENASSPRSSKNTAARSDKENKEGPTKTVRKFKDERGRTRFEKLDRTESKEDRAARLAREQKKRLTFVGFMRWALFLPVAIGVGMGVYMGLVYLLEAQTLDRHVASRVEVLSSQVNERVGEVPTPTTPVPEGALLSHEIWQFVLYHLALMLASFFYGSVGTMIAPNKRRGANIMLGVAATGMCYYLVTHLGKDDEVKMVYNFVWFLAFTGGAVAGSNVFNRYHSKTLMKKKAARARRRAELRAQRG